MRERVLAILGAAALIAVALLVRAWVVGDSSDDGDGTEGSGGRGSGGRPVVACTPDLMAVCDALAADGKIAADPPVLDLGSDTAAGAHVPAGAVDAWITWDPAPRVVNENARPNVVWAGGTPLGSAPLGLIIAPEDWDDLGPGCGWTCVTEEVSHQWPLGVGAPSTAEGLARWRPVARSLADEEDGRYQNIAASRIDTVLESPPGGQASLDLSKFVTRQGEAKAYLGPEPFLAATPQRRELTTVAPAPETAATVVLVARAGEDSGELAEKFGGRVLEEGLDAVGLAPGGTLVSDDEALGLWHIWDKAR